MENLWLTVFVALATTSCVMAAIDATISNRELLDLLLDLERRSGSDISARLSGMSEATNNLFLGDSSISDIPSDTFKKFPNAIKLYLEKNELTTLKSGMFTGLVSLRILELSHNQIASIDPTTFDDLENLVELYLGFNQISKIETNTFSKLTNLRLLKLDFNPIVELEPRAFNGLESIIKLTMWKNHLTHITPGAFEGMTGAHVNTELDLSGGLLESIRVGDLDGMPNLTSLILMDNDIATIEPGSFTNLRNLAVLKLSMNHLTRIETGTFEGLISLRLLFLAKNQITSIADGALDPKSEWEVHLVLVGNRELTCSGLCYVYKEWWAYNVWWDTRYEAPRCDGEVLWRDVDWAATCPSV